ISLNETSLAKSSTNQVTSRCPTTKPNRRKPKSRRSTSSTTRLQFESIEVVAAGRSTPPLSLREQDETGPGRLHRGRLALAIARIVQQAEMNPRHMPHVTGSSSRRLPPPIFHRLLQPPATLGCILLHHRVQADVKIGVKHALFSFRIGKRRLFDAGDHLLARQPAREHGVKIGKRLTVVLFVLQQPLPRCFDPERLRLAKKPPDAVFTIHVVKGVIDFE